MSGLRAIRKSEEEHHHEYFPENRSGSLGLGKRRDLWRQSDSGRAPSDQDKIDYHVFKPVLFEFPTYEYFVTGDKIGNCGKMNQ